MDISTCKPDTCIHVLFLTTLVTFICSWPCCAAEQGSGPRHPVLNHGVDPAKAEAYERAVERVMAIDKAEMLSFVPTKPFTRFCYCPNCHGGAQGADIFNWTIDRPEELKCKYCGMVFPNPKYPADQVLTGKNALGETVTYRYHQDKTRSDLRIFFRGQILMHKRKWVTLQLGALARAYHATLKPVYARRAALILDRIAQVYPHYPVMRQWITTFEFGPQKPPYPSAGGKWGRWMDSELPAGICEAYDLVYDSSELDKLSEERGYPVRTKIETDFFKATFEYVNTFSNHSGNMSPFYLRTAINMGRVLNEPRYVHWAYRWLLEILYGGCLYDGCWKEAPSYHYQVMGGLRRAFESMRGYTDPKGYVDEIDGRRFDNLDPDEDIAFFGRAKDAFSTVGFPNGCSAPIHDTWPNERRSSPRDKTVSTLLPGYGHASLGFGEKENQTQAQLHFSGGYGHQHLDNLNLLLFAKGREMLCDIGYTHTRARYWSTSTIGHNTVAVDRKNQVSSACEGDLLLYYPNTGGVSIVEADGKRAYGDVEGLKMYRRMLMLAPVSKTDAYVLDLFSVVGGKVHDWLLHGDADHDMRAECNVELSSQTESMLEEGETWQEPKTEQSRFIPYGAIREVETGGDDGDVTVTFTYTDKPNTGVRIHLLGGTATKIFLGSSPSIRKAGRDSQKAFELWMPQLVLRRSTAGQGPLRSLFAVVEAPFSGKPFINAISAIETRPKADGLIALHVSHGETTDTIIKTDDNPPYPERVTSTGVRLKGRLGIVRQRNGRVTNLWLFDGESLQCGGARLDMPVARYEGRILKALRRHDGARFDAFVTDVDLPVGEELKGVWMIVTHGNGRTHGYPIERIERNDGLTAIVLSMDHGLRVDGEQTQEIYFPRRKISGVNTFVIPLSCNR